jgi:uncharacterized protein
MHGDQGQIMGDISSEPSMEDILASIKKIIADDTDRKLSPARARSEPVKDLPPLPQSFSPKAVNELGEVVEPQEEDILELNVEAQAPEPVAAVSVSADPIISTAVAEASRSALSSLSRLTVKPEVAGSDSLEGLVREMLKPMLKDWLDAHLPEVVERIVAQEVARISGRSL